MDNHPATAVAQVADTDVAAFAAAVAAEDQTGHGASGHGASGLGASGHEASGLGASDAGGYDDTVMVAPLNPRRGPPRIPWG